MYLNQSISIPYAMACSAFWFHLPVLSYTILLRNENTLNWENKSPYCMHLSKCLQYTRLNQMSHYVNILCHKYFCKPVHTTMHSIQKNQATETNETKIYDAPTNILISNVNSSNSYAQLGWTKKYNS